MRRGDSFPFDVKDWRGSRAVQRMSFSERGVYFDMMLEQWDHGPLPDDPQQVADAIASTDTHQAEVLAAWPVVRRKFVEVAPGRIQNQRLERARQKPAMPVDDSPAVLAFKTSDGVWYLTAKRRAELEVSYEGVDVASELKKAVAWTEANPKKRKTGAGMPRFLVNWLSRCDRRDGEDRRQARDYVWPCPHNGACGSQTLCRNRQLLEKAKAS